MKKSLPFLFLMLAFFNLQIGFGQENIYTLPAIEVIGYQIPLIEPEACGQGVCQSVSSQYLPKNSARKSLIPANRLLHLSFKSAIFPSSKTATTVALTENDKALDSPNSYLYQGIVIDQNGNNLTGASVSLWKKEVLYGGTTVDKTGRFEILKQPNLMVKISYLGYQDALISVEDLAFDDLIILEERIYQIETCMVTTYSVPSDYNNLHVHDISKRTYEPQNTTISIAPRKWNFYPNPTQDYLRIETDAVLSANVEVIDNTGKIIALHPINGNSLMIDLSGFIDGTYYLRYNMVGKQVENIGKVVKIR